MSKVTGRPGISPLKYTVILLVTFYPASMGWKQWMMWTFFLPSFNIAEGMDSEIIRNSRDRLVECERQLNIGYFVIHPYSVFKSVYN